MADHQQSSEASAAYPPKQIADDDSMVVFVDEIQRKQVTDSEAFMDEIVAQLDASRDVRDEFLELLKGFGNDGGGAADDAHAVTSRAAELLRGHPDALRRFTAFIYMDVPAQAEQILALTRPRRSRRRSERRRGTQQQQTPLAAHIVAAAARNDGNDDDDGPRRSAADALAFVKRVHDTAGPVIHGRFLAVLSEAKGSEDMAADEIYDRAKRAFGPAHVGLLHAFATVWLPGEQEWKLQQQQARDLAARQRSRVAATSSHAGMTDAKTKPRANDDAYNGRRHDPVSIGPRRQRNRAAAASSLDIAATGMPPDAKMPRAHDGNNGRRRDHVIAVLEVRNVKKRRRDDDGPHRIGESLGGGAEAPQGRDDGYDYAPRSRAKKPHIGNGEFSGSAAAARVLGADATDVHLAYSDDNDKRPPRRRVAIGGKSSSAGTAGAVEPKQQPERDDEVRRFRQEWEFQTWYSKLVATSDRVTELLRPTRTPHGNGDGGKRSLVALFPLPECREFLRNCYGDRWGKMRTALEIGESRVPALEAIERRLTAKEEEAVVEESRKRCGHDPGRVAQRLHGLAMHYTLDEGCQRDGNLTDPSKREEKGLPHFLNHV